MKVTIEIPVRASSPKETIEQLHGIAVKEAESILRNNLPADFIVIGKPELSYVKVK
jgi:hypothetical protein